MLNLEKIKQRALWKEKPQGANINETLEMVELIESMQWISVEDKLPEDKSDVIAVTDVGNVIVGWYNNEIKGWFKSGFLVIPNITHWMLFPKPPKQYLN